MNISNLSHAGLAVFTQVFFTTLLAFFGIPLLHGAVIGGVFSTGFYFGREVAQHERKVGTPPWWSGFKIKDWSKDAVLDFVTPTIACTLVCIVALLVV